MSKKVMILIGLFLISNMLLGAEKYAVLITGDYADERGNFEGSWAIANGRDIERTSMEEFWNDTFLMWEMLLEKGYADSSIFVLFAGGQDFQDDYILEGERYIVPEALEPMTDYQADLENVEMVLEGLAIGNPQENIPQLQEDDFLYIWTFDHGYLHDGHTWLGLINEEEIRDDTFGNLVDQINCQKKVIFMQQCHSGGFVPYLENYQTVIYTATSDSNWALSSDSLYYDGIDFPGDPDPGNSYGANEWDEWSDHEYLHGEYNLHILNAIKGETPDYSNIYQTEYGDFPLEDADLNFDNIISIYEASEWNRLLNSWQWLYNGAAPPGVGTWDNPQYSDLGEIGETTSLEYPNMILSDITTSQTLQGIMAIPMDLSVSSGVTLTIADNSKVYLLNESQLTIEEEASLIIGDNVSFYGDGETINNCGFISITSNETTIFNNSHFEYCNLINSNGN